MSFLNTRWKYALSMAAWTLVANLILRVIFWSDQPLFSWNVPLSLVVGFLTGLALWPIQRSYLKTREEFRKALERQAETRKLIDDLLANPESGVTRERPKRRSDHNSFESSIDITIEEK
jgi:hypothetical protein